MDIISVIVGSVREGRFSDIPARWVVRRLKERKNVEVRLLDLKDYPMSFFDQKDSPSTRNHPPYPYEAVQKWTQQIGQADGFMIVAPEYNHGMPGVLKNALDWVSPEWNRKAVGFVAHGGASGARSVQQLRQIAVALGMATPSTAIHIPGSITFGPRDEAEKKLADLDGAAQRMIDELLWWVAALKAAREKS